MQHSQMDITADWSNLPGELWPLIGKNLKLHVEFLRFRSVCPSWRSSLPPPFLPLPPSKFPFPHSSDGSPSSYLSRTTIYLLRPPATSSFTGAFLVKIEEDCERMFLRHPVTSNRVSSEGFNLMAYDMIELGKSDYLRYIHGSGSVSGLKKVIDVTPSEIDRCAIMVISALGNLGYAGDGDLEVRWFSDHKDCVFDDVVVYKGQTYVVDTSGCVFRVDISSGLMTKISSKVVGLMLGGRKHLVESCGELYMVDMYFDQEQRSQELEFDLGFIGRRGRNRRSRPICKLKVADFKVYKLQWGNEEAEELGRLVEVDRFDDDQVMFLANDCSFAISAQWLAGSKGNCIIFTDENDVDLALREVTRAESFIFNLENHSIQKLETNQMFWPPKVELGSSSTS